MIRPIVCQSIRVSRQVAVLSVFVTSHATTFSKSGEPGAVAGERDALDQRAVLGAAQPPQVRVHLQPPDPEIQMPPPRPMLLAVLLDWASNTSTSGTQGDGGEAPP